MDGKVDDYHEHPEHQHLIIDEVVHEGEETQLSEEDIEDPSAKYIMDTSDQEPEEELT